MVAGPSWVKDHCCRSSQGVIYGPSFSAGRCALSSASVLKSEALGRDKRPEFSVNYHHCATYLSELKRHCPVRLFVSDRAHVNVTFEDRLEHLSTGACHKTAPISYRACCLFWFLSTCSDVVFLVRERPMESDPARFAAACPLLGFRSKATAHDASIHVMCCQECVVALKSTQIYVAICVLATWTGTMVPTEEVNSK